MHQGVSEYVGFNVPASGKQSIVLGPVHPCVSAIT